MKTTLLLALSVLPFAAVACGGNEPPPKEPDPVAMPTPNRATKPSLQMAQELGSLDPRKVDKTFDRIKSKVVDCQTKNLKRLDFITGHAKVFARVDASGKVRWIFFEESTIGDRDTERCVIDLFTATAWPAPEGGEGELRLSWDLPEPEAREPVAWGADKAHLGEIQDAVKKCRGGKGSPIQVTAYVEPDGKHGKVVAAGAAVADKESAEKIDCVIDAVKGLKLPSPGSYAAKLSFTL